MHSALLTFQAALTQIRQRRLDDEVQKRKIVFRGVEVCND